MTLRYRALLCSGALACVLAFGSALPAQAPAPPSAPGAAGAAASAAPAPAKPSRERIYRGTYYLRGSPASAAPLFWYERWLEPEGSLLRATHIHHALDGREVLRQSVLHSADYVIARFHSEHRQTGVVADAEALGPGRVRIVRSSGSERKEALLEHEHRLIVGPTLYGTLLLHWDALAAGRRVLVDYLSIERLDTFAFELRRVSGDASTTTFELAPKGLILSLLISPLRVVCATASRQVLRYEGPSPVSLESGKELESFDARIEYTERSAVFR